MFKTLLSLLAFAAVAFVVSTASAQSVRWEPGSGTLALNQLSELSLVFDQCEPSDNVPLPTVSGLVFGSPNRSESTSFNVVNFKATSVRTVTLTYRVRPTERTTITIPAFSIETDKGRQRVAAATFEVGDATIGHSGLTVDDVARARFTLPSQVWAGEVFPLTYTLNASKRYLYNLNKDFEWNSAPLAIEPWPNPEQIEAVLNNDPRVSIIYKTRAVAKTAGDYALHPATQLVNISTGSTALGVFARANLTQVAISSPRVDLSVKPLPVPAPASFNGAVGKFTLASNVVPASASVGEPITWTLTLDGTGNWPDIPGLPSRSVSKDFRIVQPQAKRANKDNALFDASITEDIVLIPTKPGRYTLGPVAYTVFNPATGAYENLSTQPVTITVAPSAQSGGERPSLDTGAAKQPPHEPSSPSQGPSSSVAAVSAIPRDPLPPSGSAFAPFSRTPLLVCLLSSVLMPLILWLGLALRRARITDPALPQREAHARLAATLRELATASDAVRPALIQSWQRDSAILWRLPHAVPTPGSFRSVSSSTANADEWSTLWSEADRTLYGTAPLPSDWVNRATQALATRRAPSFSAVQLFLPRNLLPLALILATALVLPTTVDAASSSESSAASPVSAYAAGNFSAAETTWSQAVKDAPTDWAAHHNLALALMQQNRPGVAAGHALAAFVQQPQNPSVRWHLGYAFKSAGVTPAALKPFLGETPLGSLARLASPTRWQLILIASAWVAALALSLGIHGAYHQRRRTGLVATLGLLSVLLAAAAGVSLRTYGLLANARTVVVVTPTTLRSIPTDLDTQKSTPLSLGVIATTDKTFLGWRRLSFPDGQTGWVRAETLVPLWKNGS